MSVRIRLADQNDLPWINQCYDTVGFVHSNLENEIIGIAYYQDKPAGIGRIVKVEKNQAELGGIYVLPEYRGQGIATLLVRFLLSLCRGGETIWCLPFAHLKDFYLSLGFQEHISTAVPEQVGAKHNWCNQTYKDPVLLLGMEIQK